MANVVKIDNYQLQNSSDTITLADELAKFIKEKKLYQNIQGKEYVNVEGWQYAGARLGIVPVAQGIENISTEDEIKYKATVDLIQLPSGLKVGAGFAICSNREQGKKYYQEFAIASMSQTRAIGKAYRNILSWILKAAGYEPTPAEEMDYENTPQPKGTAEASAEKPQAPEPKYASAKQKEEIISLLNNPTITKSEKTKMLTNLNKFDEERAEQAIEKLKSVIKEREDGQATAK